MKIGDPYVQKVFDLGIANSNKLGNLKEEIENKIFSVEEKIRLLEERVSITERKTNYMYSKFDSVSDGTLDCVSEIVKLKERIQYLETMKYKI